MILTGDDNKRGGNGKEQESKHPIFYISRVKCEWMDGWNALLFWMCIENSEQKPNHTQCKNRLGCMQELEYSRHSMYKSVQIVFAVIDSTDHQLCFCIYYILCCSMSPFAYVMHLPSTIKSILNIFLVMITFYHNLFYFFFLNKIWGFNNLLWLSTSFKHNIRLLSFKLLIAPLGFHQITQIYIYLLRKIASKTVIIVLEQFHKFLNITITLDVTWRATGAGCVRVMRTYPTGDGPRTWQLRELQNQQNKRGLRERESLLELASQRWYYNLQGNTALQILD